MAPEDRQRLILDAAERLVADRGVARCSLEAVAQAAKVSKPLVYKYFPSVDALADALLQREFDIIRGRDLTPPASDAPVELVLRVFIRSYLQYLSERGHLFLALVSHARAASSAHETARTQRREIMKFWTDHLTRAYGLPLELAQLGVIMTTAAVEGAQGPVRTGKIDVETAAEFWTTFVQGGWTAAGRRYSGKPPIRKPAAAPAVRSRRSRPR